jgi:hypothetical protein
MSIKEKKKKNKTFSITTLIACALIIIVAANIIVWKNRFDKNVEISSLTTEMSSVSREIRTITGTASDLESRLAAEKAALASVQGNFPARFNRNDIIDYIINLSRECKVEALPITSQGWLTENTGQSHNVLKLNTTIAGTYAQVNDFIYKLQHGSYETLVTPEISISRESPAVSADSFSGVKTLVTARLNITIYARPDGGQGY